MIPSYPTHKQICKTLRCPLTLSAMVHLTTWKDGVAVDRRERRVRRICAEFGYAGLAVAGLVEGTVKGGLGLLFLMSYFPSHFLSYDLYARSVELTADTWRGAFCGLATTVFSTYLLATNPFVRYPLSEHEFPTSFITSHYNTLKKHSKPIRHSLSFSAMAHLTMWRDEAGNNERYVRKISAEFGYAGLVIAGLAEAVVKGVLTILFVVGTGCPGFFFPELQSASRKLAQKSFKSAVNALETAVASLYFLGANPLSSRLPPGGDFRAEDSFQRFSSAIRHSLSFSAMANLTVWRDRAGDETKARFVRRISAEFGYAGLVIAGLAEAVAKGVLTVVFSVGLKCSGFLFPELQYAFRKLTEKSFKSTVNALTAAVASFYFLGVNPLSSELTPTVGFNTSV